MCAPGDRDLAVVDDLPREPDRRPPDRLDADPQLDLVVEHEHAQVVGLDMPARVVAAPLVEQAELPVQPGLGHLGPAEGDREVDPPAGVGVDPADAHALAVLNHAREITPFPVSGSLS